MTIRHVASRMRRFVLLFALVVSVSAAQSAEKVLTLGVYVYRSAAEMEQRFTPLVRYLSEHLEGYRIELRVLSPKEMEQALEREELDLVLTNPVHYIELREKFQMTGAIATVVSLEEGVPVNRLGGVIFARKDSGFNGTLEQVKRKRFAIFGRHSLGAFLAPRYEFHKAGIDLVKHGKLIDVPTSHDDVVRAVMNKEADVGFVRSGVLESMAHKGEIDLAEVFIINEQHYKGFGYRVSTQIYPEWPFVALPHVQGDVMRRIASLLLKIEPDDEIARQANLYGFSIPADYEVVEMMMRRLEVYPFDREEAVTLSRVWEKYAWQLSAATLLFFTVLFFLWRLERINERLRNDEQELKEANDALTQTQDALEKERAFVQGILDTEENIVMIARGGRVFQFNRRFYGLFPFADLDDFMTHHTCICTLFVSKEGYLTSSNDDRAWFEPLIAHPEGLHKAAMTDRWGEEKIFSVKARKLLFNENEYLIVTFNDITQIEAARRSSEEAQRAKSDFVAAMSHEIRTPMNGIIGFAALLEQTELSGTQRKYLDILNGSTKTLLGIINDILDFSKIESGKLELDPVQSDFRHEILLHFELFEPLAANKKIAYRMEMPEAVPVCLMVDMLRLKQVLSNLIGNAVKFTPEGGSVTVDVSVSEDTPSGVKLRFAISDTGIGIPKEKQAKVFEAFRQADSSTTRKYGGTGLGLSISSQLVELMGGQLEVQSEPGRGSTFSFELEAAVCVQNDLPRSYPIDGRKESTQPGDNPVTIRLLVAEDNDVNRLLMDEWLTKMGIEHVFAENGEAAVEIASREPFGLILMDVNMPVMDGIEATRKLRQKGIDTPIVALTANAMEGDRERLIAAGMDEYLSKPLEAAMLAQLLERYAKASEVPHAEGADPVAFLVAELGLEEAAVLRLLGLFEQSVSEEMRRLGEAIGGRDYHLIGSIAHKISGAAASLYLQPVKEAAQEIEKMGYSALEADYEALSETLRSSIIRTTERIKHGT